MSSSDSELGAPSPLPSPIFARCSPARGTVARRCREFYVRRLERTALMQKRWSICCEGEGLIPEGEEPQGPPPGPCEAGRGAPVDEGYPLRKCRSSLDLAMDSLRKEISSLIAQDNDLFRQLLSLHDSIAELRERQRRSFLCPDDEEDEDDDLDVEEEDEATTGDDDRSRRDRRSLSLESLSDPQETSPDSTLSGRSSLSGTSSDYKPVHHHHHHRYGGNHRNNNNRHRSTQDAKHRKGKGGDGGGNRPIVFVDKSAEVCFRCRKVAPPYRRSTSVASLYYLQEDLESFDSGIHLQGSHSDSDHEIFV